MGILSAMFVFLIGSIMAACDGDFSGLEAMGKFVGFFVLLFSVMWILTNPAALVFVVAIIIIICCAMFN